MTAKLRLFVSSVQKELEDDTRVIDGQRVSALGESIDNLSTEPRNLSTASRPP